MQRHTTAIDAHSLRKLDCLNQHDYHRPRAVQYAHRQEMFLRWLVVMVILCRLCLLGWSHVPTCSMLSAAVHSLVKVASVWTVVNGMDGWQAHLQLSGKASTEQSEQFAKCSVNH